MIRFKNDDYTVGAHKRILERLLETSEEQTPGYGIEVGEMATIELYTENS